MAYVTLRGLGQSELVVKRSRFIGSAAPVADEAQAWAFLEQVRAQHREATHNVYAFKVGAVVRMSDDGEPSGTAGRPVFDVLDKQSISDSIIVVTRYFGGTLLGAGGLVHAYSQTAVSATLAAGVVQAVTAVDLHLTMEYTMVGKVQYLLAQRGALTLDSQYGAGVTITCRLPADRALEFESELLEHSAGRIQIERGQEMQVGSDLRPLHESNP